MQLSYLTGKSNDVQKDIVKGMLFKSEIVAKNENKGLALEPYETTEMDREIIPKTENNLLTIDLLIFLKRKMKHGKRRMDMNEDMLSEQ